WSRDYFHFVARVYRARYDLLTTEYGPDFHEHQRNTMLYEIRTLAALPIYPNIMPCPGILAIVRDPGGCVRTFHMDVKPGNILIDDTDGIRLIDWE
ncbi:phosphotransferase enzyme family protein, partial [Verticillium dahliae]